VTYVTLSIVVLALLAGATLRVRRRLAPAPMLLAGLGLLVLTVVFDNLIVGTGIVAYDSSLISGVLIPVAPVEDLAYAIGAALLMPALWTWLARLAPHDASAATPKESP